MFLLLFLSSCFVSCTTGSPTDSIDYQSLYPDFYAVFAGKLDLANLPNYQSQSKPSYIAKDNGANAPITNQGALLGRILFYDTKLSTSETVSCSTCHAQSSAFSDLSGVSTGTNGVTGRHAMRLINSRFSTESKFFWDERAATLEVQTTKPIQDHNEMGFSGQNGDPAFSDLVTRLQTLGYYRDLFRLVYGSEEITESKIQNALAQFVRSIQSFDSKYDQGRALAPNDGANFTNFDADENAGKALFLNRPNNGGAGCAGCHRPPEFDIDPNSKNNGIIGVFNSASTDTTVTRSPTLRDLVKQDGTLNGPLMHDGSLATLEAVVEHYNSGITSNANLDPRLAPNGTPLRLNLTATQKAQLVKFLKTLSGQDVYTNNKWSNPF